MDKVKAYCENELAWVNVCRKEMENGVKYADNDPPFFDGIESVCKEVLQTLTELLGESELVQNVFGYITDDNNYLPGHNEIVISMPHEMFEDILDWWLNKDGE